MCIRDSSNLSVLSYSPTQGQPINSQSVKTLLINNQLDRQRGILYPQANPQTLLRIGKLVLYLEGKGRSKSTQIAYEKNLYYLAQRADLNNTEEVDLAIARYVKKDGHPATN